MVLNTPEFEALTVQQVQAVIGADPGHAVPGRREADHFVVAQVTVVAPQVLQKLPSVGDQQAKVGTGEDQCLAGCTARIGFQVVDAGFRQWRLVHAPRATTVLPLLQQPEAASAGADQERTTTEWQDFLDTVQVAPGLQVDRTQRAAIRGVPL